MTTRRNGTERPESFPKLMSPAEVLEACDFSRTTLYRLLRASDFPRPIRLTSRIRRWRRSDVVEWLESRTPASEVHDESSLP